MELPEQKKKRKHTDELVITSTQEKDTTKEESSLSTIIDNHLDADKIEQLVEEFKKVCLNKHVNSNATQCTLNLSRLKKSPQPFYVIRFESLFELPKIEDIYRYKQQKNEEIFDIKIFISTNEIANVVSYDLRLDIWVYKSTDKKAKREGNVLRSQPKLATPNEIAKQIENGIKEENLLGQFVPQKQILLLSEITHFLFLQLFDENVDIHLDCYSSDINYFRIWLYELKEISLNLLIDIKKQIIEKSSILTFDLDSRYIKFRKNDLFPYEYVFNLQFYFTK